MRTSFGLQLFKDFGDAVQHFLDFASKGSEFVPRPHESISSGVMRSSETATKTSLLSTSCRCGLRPEALCVCRS